MTQDGGRLCMAPLAANTIPLRPAMLNRYVFFLYIVQSCEAYRLFYHTGVGRQKIETRFAKLKLIFISVAPPRGAKSTELYKTLRLLTESLLRRSGEIVGTTKIFRVSIRPETTISILQSGVSVALLSLWR